MRRVACRPLVPGISMSIRMTSGLSCCANRTASSPSDASPTNIQSCCTSKIRRRNLRYSLLSSTIRTLMVSDFLEGLDTVSLLLLRSYYDNWGKHAFSAKANPLVTFPTLCLGSGLPIWCRLRDEVGSPHGGSFHRHLPQTRGTY